MKHSGVYPPASCGFYALYDGKADYFFIRRLQYVLLYRPVLKPLKNNEKRGKIVTGDGKWTEETPIENKKFHLPSRKKSLEDTSIEIIVVD